MEQASAALTQLLHRMQQQSAMAFTSDPKAASRELERRKAECYNREEGTLNQQDNYNCPLCGIIWRHCRPYPGCSLAPGNGTRPIRAKIENAPRQGAKKPEVGIREIRPRCPPPAKFAKGKFIFPVLWSTAAPGRL